MGVCCRVFPACSSLIALAIVGEILCDEAQCCPCFPAQENCFRVVRNVRDLVSLKGFALINFQRWPANHR